MEKNSQIFWNLHYDKRKKSIESWVEKTFSAYGVGFTNLNNENYWNNFLCVKKERSDCKSITILEPSMLV